jgi:hypothetical protein
MSALAAELFKIILWYISVITSHRELSGDALIILNIFVKVDLSGNDIKLFDADGMNVLFASKSIKRLIITLFLM